MYYITIFNYYNNKVKSYERDSFEKAKKCARFYLSKIEDKGVWATIEDEEYRLHYIIEKTGVEIDYHKTTLDRPF